MSSWWHYLFNRVSGQLVEDAAVPGVGVATEADFEGVKYNTNNNYGDKMKVKSADGVSVAYQVKGSGSPALVFFHGWSCDKSYWEPQTSHFSKKHKVVTVDLGGHGESGLERENWTVDAFAADVAAVVNKLDLKKVVLIGHSMGGPVVVEAARLMPDRVIGVVGVDTFGDIDRKRMPPPTEDRLARFRSNFVETTREMVKSMFLETSDPKLVEKIVLDMSSAPPKVGIGAMKGMSDYDLPGTFEKIKVPVYGVSILSIALSILRLPDSILHPSK